MCMSIPNEMTLYCISEGTPNMLRFFDNSQEAQRALELIHDAFKKSGHDCEYNLFTVTLTKVNPD